MSSNRIGRIGQWGGSNDNNNNSQSGGRFATLRDIAGPSQPAPAPGGGGHGSDDEDSNGDANEGPENWYTGGERSGLSVENPDRRSGNNVVRDILRKAAEASAPAQPAALASGSSGTFGGSGYILGSDEVESSVVPDPNAQPAAEEGDDQEVATRHITFWRDGFSVEDGALMRYDEPENSRILDEINTGHAPPQILDVRVGQPVELRVTRRLNEDYIPPPKRPLGPFGGEGHRLGDVVPQVIRGGSSSSSTQAIPGAFPTPSSADTAPARSAINTHFEVDQSLPTTSVTVRLADGTRLVARMNLRHTVRDIRNFINASRPGSSSVTYTINTTFPNRVLDDETQTIEQAGLKNSLVVQRVL
ncbi:hypothetical protein M422DRAFT_784894 [Sphaerobolus stellatus SS14]|uniref:UBX domain-containing protein 1 n=1 Tax=Sphaerobolus stellatus (strain SS14) TaxID=990650 RepID=A0A0C9UPY5_SPHS4|nr:hypothetical protein M422DRAFT_784894 [Sphaerobolus stellatus SS14]